MTTENKKLNVFIDAGNGAESTPDLISEIALVKNMEHVETVFVFAKEDNSIKATVTKNKGDTFTKAYEEYAGETFISVTDQLNNKPNKVIIYNTQNVTLDTKLSKDLSPLKEDALMIRVPDESMIVKVLHLFTHKTPTDFENIQLFVPKGDATNDKLVMNMVKDAAMLRGLKINIRGSQKGGFLGLFGKKKYDVKAAEIVKKLLKEKKTFTDVKNNVEAELQKYYGYEPKKTGLTGSALKKWTEAKNNVARALHTVEKLLAEAVAAPKKEKTPSYSTIVKMKSAEKKQHQDKKKAERDAALAARKLTIVKGKSAELLNTHLNASKPVEKGALGKPDLIIRHEDDKTMYPTDTTCIVYNNTTLPILDLLLTAQFSEPTRLRELFYKGTGTKKSGIVSKIKRGVSRLGDIDIEKTRKRRSSSSRQLAAKIKSKAISRTSLEKKAIDKHLNNAKEALATKKAELKRLGFALFGEKRTKKKQLQANIAELEKKLKTHSKP